MQLVISTVANDIVVDHLSENTSRELGGFLFGEATTSSDSMVTRITMAFPCRNAPGSMGHLTFTPDCWQEAHAHLHTCSDDTKIVGWYHSHPGMQTTMSSQDKWLHSNFFDAPHFIAWIRDPIRAVDSHWHWNDGPVQVIPTPQRHEA